MEYNATNPLPSLLKHFRKKAGLTLTMREETEYLIW